MNLVTGCNFQLPQWIDPFIGQWEGLPDSNASGMRLAIALATENVCQRTGGPFAAVVIDEQAAEVVSVGVNLVTETRLSIAHAEIIALSLAQQRLGDWNLSRQASLTLVSTCEPCAMCFGAVPWSGIQKMVCGSRKEDAEAAGFDEGDKPADWIASLRSRGIEVEMDVLREEANAVFRKYAQRGGEIYNAGPEQQD
jgi:tRNA(Arg) A34 adenosine deaminase TadA